MKDCPIIASDNWWGKVTHVITYHRKRGHTLINIVCWFALYFTLFCEYYRVIEQVSPYSLLESGLNQFIVSPVDFIYMKLQMDISNVYRIDLYIKLHFKLIKINFMFLPDWVYIGLLGKIKLKLFICFIINITISITTTLLVFQVFFKNKLC